MNYRTLVLMLECSNVSLYLISLMNSTMYYTWYRPLQNPHEWCDG